MTEGDRQFAAGLEPVARETRGSLLSSNITRHRIWYVTVMVLLLVGAAVMVFPLIWQISSSLKNDAEIHRWPIQLIPDPLRWGNYPRVFQLVPMAVYTRNTVVITLLSVAGTVISSSLVAYAFAYLRTPGRNILFAALLGTMMLPGQVTMIPVFVMFSQLHWIDTWYPLIVPTFFGNPFYIFLLRQFFLSLPPELSDAVKIDGGNYWSIFRHVVLPLSKPALATVAVFAFMAHWNDFFGPLLYLTSDLNKTLAVALVRMQSDYFNQEQYLSLLMAGSVMMLIPVLIVFFLAQRVFVSGVTLTGIAGR